MDWIDEPGGEELWQEWEWLFEDVSSTVERLASQFAGNETDDVVLFASLLMDGVVALHESAGALFLPTESTFGIAHDLDLADRLTVEAELDDEDGDMGDDECRDVGVVFKAVAEHATKVCHLVDRAKCRVAGDVEEAGQPLLASLVGLADAAMILVEWVHIYVETACGYYRVTGQLPDSAFGGGGLAELHDWDRGRLLLA